MAIYTLKLQYYKHSTHVSINVWIYYNYLADGHVHECGDPGCKMGFTKIKALSSQLGRFSSNVFYVKASETSEGVIMKEI